MTAETLQAGRTRHPDHASAVEEYYWRGWTDGLPVIPPEPAMVAAFLDSGGVTAGEVLGTVATRDVIVTAEDVAINAVMAGCLAEYAPVVMTAVAALLHEEAIPHSVTATLASAAQMVIVSGPVRKQIGVECEQGCMGPGFRANATIGRALRLVVRNVLRSVPHQLDRATFSTPGRYSFCFGEDEEGTSWTPLHVERGLRADQSAVTVASTIGPIIVRPHSHVPEVIIGYLGRVLFLEGSLWEHQFGSVCDLPIVLGQEHQRFFTASGWSKADIRQALWDEISSLRRESDGSVLRLGRPEGILPVAAGGPGDQVTAVMPPHVGLAVTLPLPTPPSLPSRPASAGRQEVFP
ncbi:MAG TPA: hypothetical protein VH307_13570 [Streptosporangiaceae bacterium]|nr:hypothetical protein [Streptosporangiaceae bacterium]